MDIKLSLLKQGDTVVTKKNHPCGGNRWKIVATGVDFRLCCEKCGRMLVMPSETLKKSAKSIEPSIDNSEV